MGLRGWWSTVRRRERNRGDQTPDERASVDKYRRSTGADDKATRLAGQTIKGAERLGDAE